MDISAALELVADPSSRANATPEQVDAVRLAVYTLLTSDQKVAGRTASELISILEWSGWNRKYATCTQSHALSV